MTDMLFRVDINRAPGASLFTASCDFLPGLLMHSRTRGEIERRAPGLVRDILKPEDPSGLQAEGLMIDGEYVVRVSTAAV